MGKNYSVEENMSSLSINNIDIVSFYINLVNSILNFSSTLHMICDAVRHIKFMYFVGTTSINK